MNYYQNNGEKILIYQNNKSYYQNNKDILKKKQRLEIKTYQKNKKK